MNGARADNVGFLVDGMNNTQRRNTGAVINLLLEGVQEFKMTTSGFAAEYGRYAGGVLSVVTKSGSNRFLRVARRVPAQRLLGRHQLLRCRQIQAAAQSVRRHHHRPGTHSQALQRQGPHVLYGHLESLRLTDGKTQRGIAPQPEMLARRLHEGCRRLRPLHPHYRPAGQSPFPNNQIPASRLNPVSLKLASYYPAPNLTGSANNFIAQGNGTNIYNNFGVKVDHLDQLSERDRLTLSTFWRPANNWDPAVNSRSPLPLFGLQAQTLDLLAYVKYLAHHRAHAFPGTERKLLPQDQ